MTLRLVASAANALQGYELEFAHSATRPPLPLQVAGGGPITPLQRAFERLANLCRHQDALAPIGPGLPSVSHNTSRPSTAREWSHPSGSHNADFQASSAALRVSVSPPWCRAGT